MLLVAVPPSSSSLTSEGLFEALKWVEGEKSAFPKDIYLEIVPTIDHNLNYKS